MLEFDMTFPLFAAKKKFISPHRRRTNQVPVFEAAGGRRNIRVLHILHSVLIKLNLAELGTIRNGAITEEPEHTSAGYQEMTIQEHGSGCKEAMKIYLHIQAVIIEKIPFMNFFNMGCP